MQGRNRLHLSALDKDHYCVLVHLAQQRTDGEVKDMMHAPETMQEALRRVQVHSSPGTHLCHSTACHLPQQCTCQAAAAHPVSVTWKARSLSMLVGCDVIDRGLLCCDGMPGPCWQMAWLLKRGLNCSGWHWKG